MLSGRILAAILAGAALLTATRSSAAESSAAEAPVVREKVADGVFDLEGTFEVTAPASIVWGVLTDYDQISRFVSSMRRSVVRERSQSAILVEQTAVGRLLFFSREVRVLLELREEPPSLLQFKDVSGQDFELYNGRWVVLESPERTKVVYQLTAKPKARVPGFIKSSVFQASASELLAEVRTEIIRRVARQDCERAVASTTDAGTKGKPSCR